MEERKNFSEAPRSCHWTLISFILFIHFLFFSVIQFLLTTVNANFLEFNSFKILLTYRSSPQRCSPIKRYFSGLLQIFSEYRYLGVMSIKLESGFVKISSLLGCSPVNLYLVCITPSLENNCRRLFWTQIAVYTIFNLLFLVNILLRILKF